MVAWENATIRRKCDLPQVDRKAAPWGIVRVEVSPPSSGAAATQAPEPPAATAPKDSGFASNGQPAAEAQKGEQGKEEGKEEGASKATCARREPLIAALAALGWRRIDVKTKANPRACLSCDCLAVLPHDTILLQCPHEDDHFQFVAESVSDLISKSIRKTEDSYN